MSAHFSTGFEQPRRLLAAGLLVITLALAACGGDPGAPGVVTPPPGGRPVLSGTYRPTGHAAAGDVFVHLFEWKWTDIATECESVLGPAGYRAVQVSPPQEHIVLPSHPWWTRYQPVSYSIDRSRSGTRSEFIDMVNRCDGAGVDIYVDAVINHMTAGAGTGTNGTVYTKYAYPGLYTQADFHSPCAITNYQNAANVQDCELVGLADLKTGAASVRQKIADYLVGLSRIGVAGFRIDAAKHMQPVELDSILDLVNETLTAEGRPRPYYFAEVIDHGGEAVRAAQYYGLGYSSGGAADITEFKFRGVGDKFLGLPDQRIAQLNPNGTAGNQFSQTAWGLMPADKAVVFLENHDTQRGSGVSYREPDLYRLANVWMLAQPYGYPKVMSSYAFDRNSQAGDDAGPPADGAGNTRSVVCPAQMEQAAIGGWVCEHRDPYITAMVGFRKAVAGAPITGWWDNGTNAIAFSRGDKGFVAINNADGALTQSVPTTLPAGTYCDVLTGGLNSNACVGRSLVIDASGTAQVTLEPRRAIAAHAGSRLQ